MIDRRTILDQALHDCYKEMYAKAQPSADWDQIVQEFKDGKRDSVERVYEQHYLSKEEYKYITEKYANAYNINSHWRDDIEVLENYLTNGGNRDKYIKEHIDENGNWHPGYRSYEKVPALREQLAEIIKDENVLGEVVDKVMSTIKECKDYYRFDREASDWGISCALGASPTSNPETVKKYWKEKTGEDINIELHLPELFWYYDNGYTDEDLAYEFEDLGENWKEVLTQKYMEEQAQIEKEQEERLKKLEEELKKQKDEGKDA